METYQILSRRADGSVDFSTDKASGSPSDQLRRLSALLRFDHINSDTIEDAEDAVDYWREFLYRKIFTGTSHEQFIETDRTDPQAIDWLIAVSAIDTKAYQDKRKETRAQ